MSATTCSRDVRCVVRTRVKKRKKEIVYSSLRRKYRDEISEQGKLVKIFEKRMDSILEEDAIEEF